MNTKLTLRMDDELVARAKAYAQANDISVSRMVADVFRQLPETGDRPQRSGWIERLRGAARGAERGPTTDDEVRDLFLNHVESKHA